MTLNPKILTFLTLLNTSVLLLLAFIVFSGKPLNTVSELPNSKEKPSLNIDKSDEVKKGGGSGQREKPAEGASDFASLLEQTIQPLKQASSDHNEAIDLPTDKEIAAAIDTDKLDSVESQLVIEKLQKGYEYYNMPFPALRIPEAPNQEQGKPPPMRDNSAGPQIESWMKPTIERLQLEIENRGESGEGLIPSEDEQQAAIDSETWDSQETQLVLDVLKKGFSRYSIEFPEPKDIQKLSQDKSLPSKGGGSSQKLSSKQRILQAYFKGQLQRLRLESNAKSKDITGMMPSDEEVFQAVKTAKLDSDESKIVLEKLRICCEELEIKFYEPAIPE